MYTFDKKLSQMAGKKTYIDTNILIYFFNEEPKYFHLVSQFLTHCAHNEIFGVVSELVIAEILVQPYRQRDLETVTQIKSFFGQTDFLQICEHQK